MRNIHWPILIAIITLHAVALLAVLPAFWSPSGAVLAAVGYYVFGVLGINCGYHRLLAHRAFACPLWFERFLAVLGCCCLVGPPGQFVATHRLHHAHPDEPRDPHSPLFPSLFHAHCGWLMADRGFVRTVGESLQLAKDIYRDPFYRSLDLHWLTIYALHAGLISLVGHAVGGWWTAGSWLVWGVAMRTVAVWHATWSVNSIAHAWGARPYAGHGNARNNWLVALVANGEGWHNNHHALPRSARHGHRWWQLDTTWLTIRLWERIGLVTRVVRPRREKGCQVGQDKESRP